MTCPVAQMQILSDPQATKSLYVSFVSHRMENNTALKVFTKPDPFLEI